MLFGVVTEQCVVKAVVGFIKEDIESANAALCDVVRKTRTDNPSQSRHKQFP